MLLHRLKPFLGLLCVLSVGCERSEEEPQPSASSSAAQPATPDRLAPGELEQGKGDAFGLALPRGMIIERRFPDAVHAVGPLKPEAVAAYVRKRVVVSHVEMGAARTVFPKLKINGGAADRTYRIDIIADAGRTRLVVRDITPPPPTVGLSEAERWKRAGMTPDGKPLNVKQLE